MPPSSPLRIPATRAGAVADEIRRQIISGELPAGTPLRQLEVAERFGVSTTPVREAFTALAREGFVRQDSHRGVVVFEPSVADVRENFEIRVALESLAAELAAKSVTEEALDELDGILEEMRTRGREDLVYQTSVLNPRLHRIIYDAADRPRLIELIDNLRGAAVAYQLVLVGADLTVPEDYLDQVQAEHEEIVEALRARAPKRAAKAVRVHIEHTLKLITAELKRRRAASE